MKKEVSPAVMIAIIAVLVLALAVFFWRKVAVNPPTPTDNVDAFLRGGAPGASAPEGAATPPETAPPAGQPVPGSPGR